METPDNIAQQYALKCKELEELQQAMHHMCADSIRLFRSNLRLRDKLRKHLPELRRLRKDYLLQGKQKNALQLRVQELEDICKQQNEVMHQQDQINKQSIRQTDVAIEELKKVIAIAQHLERQVSDKDKHIAELEEIVAAQKAVNELQRDSNKDKDTLIEANAAEIQRLKEANERLAAHNTDMEIECRRVLRESKQPEPETERVEVWHEWNSWFNGSYNEHDPLGWFEMHEGEQVMVPDEYIPKIIVTEDEGEHFPTKGYYLKPKQPQS